MTTLSRGSVLWAVLSTAWLPAASIAPPAHARTIYVRESGDDANDGLTAPDALRTISAAAEVAEAFDTVLVGPGTYFEGDLNPSAFGHVRFVADRRGEGVGDPAGDVIIDATGFTSGFEINGKLAITIDGFVINGTQIGIYAKSGSHRAVISNNIVSNNGNSGIYVQDSRDVVVFNNLVYNNGRTGILITGNVDGSRRAHILNNTVYRHSNRGIFFSGTTVGSPNGLVLNNIVEKNSPAGIQVNLTSRTGYLSAGNIVFDNAADFASGTPIDVTDQPNTDPLFVDPDGADDALGGINYADDNFRLQQARAGQAATSPAVDAGSDLSRRLNLLRSTTRSDGKPDRGIVDAGYHYNNFSPPPANPAERIRPKKLYVSQANGNDANLGETRETAVRTLMRAFTLANPGHLVSILDGAYSEGQLNVPSGNAGRPVVVKAFNGARIIGPTGQSALVLSGASHITLDGLRVSGAGQSGIEIRQASSDIVLRRCRLSANERRGLSVRNSTGILVTSSTIENNGSRGVQVDDSEVTIVRSSINGNIETGLWAFGGSTVAVSTTEFTGNRADGILAEQSEVSVVGGTIKGSVEGGARFREGSNGTLENVEVLDNTDVGVQSISSVVSISGGSIRGNTIGLWASGGSTVAVSTTEFTGNRADGILAEQSEVSVVGGTIKGSVEGGARFREGSNGTLENVEVLDNTDVGVQSISSVVGISGGSICGSSIGVQSFGDPISQAPSALTIDGTRVCDNETGLWAFGGSTVAVSTTEFTGNRADGILADQSEVSVIGGTIKGSVEGGARFRDGSNGTLENVEVLDNTDVGVQSISSVVSISGGSIRGSTIGVQSFVDPISQAPAAVTIDGTRVCDNRGIGIDARATALTGVGADLCANGEGLRQRGGTVDLSGVKVRANQSVGMSATDTTRVTVHEALVNDNRGHGISVVRGGDVEIEDSISHDNDGDGLRIFDSPAADIVNNLVYGNGVTGIRISGDSVGSPDALVGYNTVYGNITRGLFIGGADNDPASTNAVVTGNVFQRNGNAGIQVNTLSLVGYEGDFNLNRDPYGANTPPGDNDLFDDPLFVAPDAGDFHLSQTAAGQGVSSPAVDAGSTTAAASGMATKTTRTDKVTDRGIVDLGYHYLP